MPRERKQHLTRRKDGRFKAVYRGMQFFGHTEEEALAAREAYKQAEIRGDTLNDNVSVYEYALKWLPIHKASVSVNTYSAYAGLLNKLVASVGRMKMSDVSPSDIKAVYNEFLGQSESTIRKARMLYVDLWDCAIEDGIAMRNPCRSKAASPHHGTSGSHRALSEEEDELILIHENKLRLAALLMRYAGLRRGEVMAFDIDENVDFDRNIIIVKNAVHFEGNKGVLGNPKTIAGKREIPLLEILKRELSGKHGRVLPENMTTSMWRSLWAQYLHSLEARINKCSQKRWFHKTKDWIESHPEEFKHYLNLKKRSQAEAEKFRLSEWKSVHIRPHDLRHSYCTLLRDSGVDLKLAVLWMGHSDEKMILRVYDHPSENRVRSAIESLNKSANQVQMQVQEKMIINESVGLTGVSD